MGIKAEKTCYMCGEPATTREHVPPKCFFIEPFNRELAWVPSCERHNNANAKDVEYVRGVIATALQTNDVARKVGAGKVIRTFKKSPKLFKRMLKDAVPVTVNGEDSVAFNAETDRLRVVMVAIAHAMHFHHFGKRFFGHWWFYSPQMVSIPALVAGEDHKLDPIRRAFNSIPITDVDTVHPDIFRFGFFRSPTQELWFRFVFYGGFSVYAAGVPFFRRFEIPKGTF